MFTIEITDTGTLFDPDIGWSIARVLDDVARQVRRLEPGSGLCSGTAKDRKTDIAAKWSFDTGVRLPRDLAGYDVVAVFPNLTKAAVQVMSDNPAAKQAFIRLFNERTK